MKVVGVYWCGDLKNEQLQCIYGMVWMKKEDQDQYLYMFEEVEKCDYCKLGKQFDLFYMQEELLGMVFWYLKGWVLWQQVEQYMCCCVNEVGYFEIKMLMIMDCLLWEVLGYWQNYCENMFMMELEKCDYVIKLMNCLGYVQVFKYGLCLYCDLLLCYVEFGLCYCNEVLGVLYGLMCVCGFVQDDVYIFCMED